MYKLNDFVRIIEGEFEGEIGSVLQSGDNSVIAYFLSIKANPIIITNSMIELVSQ